MRDPAPNTKKIEKKSHRSKVSSGNSTSYFDHFHFNLPQWVGLFHLSMELLNKSSILRMLDFHDDVELFTSFTVAAILDILRKTTRTIAKRKTLFLLNLPRRYSSIFVYGNKLILFDFQQKKS